MIKSFGVLGLLVALLAPSAGKGLDFFEDFDRKGKPKGPAGIYWYVKSDLHPKQSGWNAFIPGDGFVHITLDSDPRNDGKKRGYQMIVFGKVPPNHRIEIMAKNLVIPGFVGHLFTFMYPKGWNSNPTKSIFHEIDIEVVADDTQGPGGEHPIDPPEGWTDARFNSWAAADEKTFKPFSGTKQAIVDDRGEKVSHRDGAFHVYTIDWIHSGNRRGLIRLFIDGVLQHEIAKPVPDIPCEVLTGFRALDWAGKAKWKGTQTCLVDWIRVKPIDARSPVAHADRYEAKNRELSVASPGVLGNDSGGGLAASVVSEPGQGKLVLNQDGSFSYVPRSGFHGTDRFTYRASRKSGGESNAAVVWIDVP